MGTFRSIDIFKLEAVEPLLRIKRRNKESENKEQHIVTSQGISNIDLIIKLSLDMTCSYYKTRRRTEYCNKLADQQYRKQLLFQHHAVGLALAIKAPLSFFHASFVAPSDQRKLPYKVQISL